MTGWTPEQIEQVARAICRSRECEQLYRYDEATDKMVEVHLSWEFTGEYKTLEDAIEGNWKYHVDAANAAISALPSPTAARDKALEEAKRRLDYRLNEHLAGMREGYDDSVAGFNEAWDIMRSFFNNVLASSPPAPASASSPGASPERDGRRETLFEAIKHGDEDHRRWLKEAIDNHFAGRPVPPPYGKGTAIGLPAPSATQVFDPSTADLASMRKVVEAAQRHINSFEPGTLEGSELNLKNALDALASLTPSQAKEMDDNG